MSVDFPNYVTSNGFVSIRDQILWNLQLAMSHNWFKSGISLYVSSRISCYLQGVDCQLFYAQTNDDQCVQYA